MMQQPPRLRSLLLSSMLPRLVLLVAVLSIILFALSFHFIVKQTDQLQQQSVDGLEQDIRKNMARPKKRDPKVGTGKKPKGSDRRLYTDENPKDTVSIKFATPADARATVAKVKKINKPYARKIQILTVGEQRAKVMGKTEVVAIFKKAKEQLKKQHERRKKKKV